MVWEWEGWEKGWEGHMVVHNKALEWEEVWEWEGAQWVLVAEEHNKVVELALEWEELELEWEELAQA